MKRCVLFTILALIAAPIAVFAQTLSISATSTDGTAYYNNTQTSTWIDGSVTVTRSSASSNPTYYTVDLSPNADQVNGSYPRNSNWTFYSISGTSTSNFYLDSAEIYTGSTHSYNGSNVWKLWDQTGIGDASVVANNVFSGSMTGSTLSATYPFAAVFWQNGTLASGFYELPVTFRVRKEQFVANTAPTTEPVASQTIMIRFIVGYYATIFFKDSTNSYELFAIDFDNITSNATKSFNLNIQSNFRYKLAVKSINGGKLRHERYGASTNPVNEQVSYTMSYNGTTYALASGTSYTMATKQKATGFGTNSRSYPITLTLGTIDNLTAGEFSDSLAFTVTAQ